MGDRADAANSASLFFRRGGSADFDSPQTFSWLLAAITNMELSGKNKAVTRETIYPYIVPEPYVERLDRGPDGFIPWIGHDVYVLLVDDMRGVCRNIRMDELYALNFNVEFAHQLAIQNLQALARSGQIQKACCHAPMDR